MQETQKIWMDGQFVEWKEAKVHVLSHPLHYGLGVFEGIRCYETKRGPAVFRLKEHVDRLFDSTKISLIEIPYSREEVTEAILETIRVNKVSSCYIRPLVFLGYGVMGLNPAGAPVHVSVAVWPWVVEMSKHSIRFGGATRPSSLRACSTSTSRIACAVAPNH